MNNTQPEKDLTSPPVHGVCPPWCCFTFDNAFRRLLQNPNRILRPYIKPGWTVLDVGPGMGYFTIPMARLVGDTGKVIAADVQQKMLDGLDHRAFKAGVQERIKLQLTKAGQYWHQRIYRFLPGFLDGARGPGPGSFFKRDSINIKTGWTDVNRGTKDTRFERTFCKNAGNSEERRPGDNG